MNPDVLEIYDISFSHDNICTVEAIVEDAAIAERQTMDDPEEYCPALCRGSFYFSEEDVIPATDAGLKRLFAEKIDNWELVDTSDWGE
jgi:hypothetical protein